MGGNSINLTNTLFPTLSLRTGKGNVEFGSQNGIKGFNPQVKVQQGAPNPSAGAGLLEAEDYDAALKAISLFGDASKVSSTNFFATEPTSNAGVATVNNERISLPINLGDGELHPKYNPNEHAFCCFG